MVRPERVPCIRDGSNRSPGKEDEHFTTLCRYVERNALRANLVGRAEAWRWSSVWHRVNRSRSMTLNHWPVPREHQWIDFVNDAETEAEWKALRRPVKRGAPFGTAVWQQKTAKRLGLESSLRSPGRPRKQASSNKYHGQQV